MATWAVSSSRNPAAALFQKLSTKMGFEPTRAEPNALAVHRLNHSATSSHWKSKGTDHATRVSQCHYRQWYLLVTLLYPSRGWQPEQTDVARKRSTLRAWNCHPQWRISITWRQDKTEDAGDRTRGLPHAKLYHWATHPAFMEHMISHNSVSSIV